MEFNPNDVQEIDQNSVEQSGPQYPSIQWHYGDAKAKKIGGMDYCGGWFVKSDQIEEETATAAGWTKTTWTHDTGSEEEGFWRREIEVSVIAARRRWEVVSDFARQYFAWNKYDDAKLAGKASGRLHLLCLVKGMEDVGPFVLTLKGMSALAVEGNRQNSGVLTKFAQTVITAANKASEAAVKKNGGQPARWPYRAFWLTIGADRDGKDEPVFTEVGKDKATSRVVLPKPMNLPAKAEQVNLADYYIGKALLTTVNDLWAVAETNWTHAWDSIAPTAEVAAEAAVVAANSTAAANEDLIAEYGL